MTDWRCQICGEQDCDENMMCIYSGAGTRVIYTGVGGCDADRDYANAKLTVGATYIVDKEGTEVCDWSSTVKLRGVDGWFNTVLFSRGKMETN